MAPSKAANRNRKGGFLFQNVAILGVVGLLAAFFGSRLMPYYGKHVAQFQSIELSPLRAPKLTDLTEFDATYKDQMLWGSYRSGLYFGMRTRTPKSLLFGMMWFDPDDPITLHQMRARHEANQGDGLASYGWKRHDGRLYGTQELVDGEYNITLSMLKSFSQGSGPGGDWSLRVQLARTPGVARRRRRISVIVYLGDEDAPREPWQMFPDGEVTDLRSSPAKLLTGASKSIGKGGAKWTLHALETTNATVSSSRSRGCRVDYLSLAMVNKDYLLRIKDLALSAMWEVVERQPASNRFHLYLPNGASTSADLAMFQLTCALPSTVDFAFTNSGGRSSDEGDRLGRLLGPGLEEALAFQQAEFDDRFERIFGTGLRRRQQFSSADGSSEGSEAAVPGTTLEVSRAALSNLLGSVGYFYGSSLVRTGGPDSRPQSYWPAPLFTAVPSRSFFPRGFLWDEGFHQLLVQKWDPQLSRDMIAHWLDLMNAQGWIPREQILGDEARMRVPAEFVVQNSNHANPPSLFLPIAKMASQLVHAAVKAQGAHKSMQGFDSEELARVSAFLRRAWPRLEAWYNWFNTTQAGPLPTSYRWHGRDPLTTAELNPKTLTSGLDDYPRASHPDDLERHLDLRCWMALASQAMYDIGSSLGLPAAVVTRYRAAAASLSDVAELQRLHYDADLGRFADWGMHTEDVQLTTRATTGPDPNGQPQQQISQRVANTPPTPQHVPQYGYVSLFPLIMKLLPLDGSGTELTLKQLELLQDPSLLWSPYGLRSLASTASLYKKRNTADDPPYWRGQIWINMNYLVLRALSHYAQEGAENVSRAAAAAHDELQLRILKTLVSNYQQNGYLYEQYDDETGRGMSSHPFTGWTALVTLIAAQEY